MTKVCICQICNCGRHKCPHKPQGVINKGQQPCVLSEYTNRYHQHPIEPTRSFKPTQQPVKGDGAMDDATTNRVDYVRHPLERPHHHEGEKYVAPEGNIDDMTTHKRDYTPKAINRQGPVKKEYTRKTPGKFEGEPTYKNDFRQWALPRTQKITHDPDYRPPSAAFAGDSNYHRDFITHKINPRQSLRPMETNRNSDQPFDGQTGYRDEFIRHPIPAKEAKEKQQWAPNPAQLDGLSNYKKDYTAKEMTKTGNCKPDQKPYDSNVPFESGTTNRTDFKAWPTSRPYHHEQGAYNRPEGDFDMNTTSHTDYTRKPMQRTMAIKPDGNRGVPGKFEGNTNYSTDFRKWTPGERPKLMMKSEYSPPDAPFKGTPTYVSDYISHRALPRQSMRPTENSKLSEQPFDGQTGYRDEFIKHKMPDRHEREKPQWEPNPAQLDGMSNYKKDYTNKEIPVNKSCKPDAGAYQSVVPFEGDTTHKSDYVGHKADQPTFRQQAEYQKPEGQMDMYTTTHTDFTKKPINRASAKRPSSVKRIPGKFDGNTNYNADFRGFKTERAMPKPKDDYVAPNAPFQGTSNYHDDFQRKNQGPTRSMKPADRAQQSDAPFEDGTEYRKEYTKKAKPDCPAHVIERGGTAGYNFQEQDDTGHKWYAPTSVSISALPGTTNNPQLLALSVA